MERQKPFLKSLLNEAEHKKREQLLRYANKDQINAISELVMNTLRSKVPIAPKVIKGLKPHRSLMYQLTNKRNSMKKRKHLLVSQKGGGFWKGLGECYKKCGA